ncbi:MAG TPA: glycosyltransferase family 4 protein [Nitrososphaeraceae archaeon]|jgi:glycosyltransferase involved in cell wall biosynthesis
MAKIQSFHLIALLITIYFPPEPGGGSTNAWNRAKMLHNLGYSVFIITNMPSYPNGKILDKKYTGKLFYVEVMDSFTVIRLRLPSIKHEGYVKRLILFLDFILLCFLYMPRIVKITGKITLVYALAPIIFSSTIGYIYSKFSKSWFVYEAADLWPEELVVFKTYLSPFIKLFGKPIAKLSYKYADIIFTISNRAVELIVKEYHPKSPVYSLPIGVDPSRFPIVSKYQSRTELINNKIFPENLKDKFIVLYSGIISRAQRIENLAYLAKELKNEKEIAILIVGDGEDKEKMVQLKIENGLDNFYILPYQPRSLMPSILSAVDVCTVLLSPEPIFEIAVPSKFYEFLACHKPIVGMCRGELADIINSKNIGYTTDIGDISKLATIIRRMKNSPTVMDTVERNSELALQNFSIDAISSKLREALKKEGKYI